LTFTKLKGTNCANNVHNPRKLIKFMMYMIA
jgi:hypothetical protein